jgi:hypothetical protein
MDEAHKKSSEQWQDYLAGLEVSPAPADATFSGGFTPNGTAAFLQAWTHLHLLP